VEDQFKEHKEKLKQNTGKRVDTELTEDEDLFSKKCECILLNSHI
jgi:hypothetical protein